MSALVASELTPERVQQEVEWLRTNSNSDPEALHGLEDDLHLAVLRAIALGDLQGADAARAALYASSTADIKFPRWMA